MAKLVMLVLWHGIGIAKLVMPVLGFVEIAASLTRALLDIGMNQATPEKKIPKRRYPYKQTLGLDSCLRGHEEVRDLRGKRFALK
ncbi:MAG: hypothetical protein ACFCVD_15215 [Nodosilinea sp.]